MSKRTNGDVTAIGPEVTNGAAQAIEFSQPFTVDVTIEGTADLLFHRWNCEAVEEKSKAAKGSKAKKTDNVESYVYRNDDGQLCLPGEYLRQAIIHAAKFRQDPRSPRKSAMDLFKAGDRAADDSRAHLSHGTECTGESVGLRAQVPRHRSAQRRDARSAGDEAGLAMHDPVDVQSA
jgi:hypothetical protein